MEGLVHETKIIVLAELCQFYEAGSKLDIAGYIVDLNKVEVVWHV